MSDEQEDFNPYTNVSSSDKTEVPIEPPSPDETVISNASPTALSSIPVLPQTLSSHSNDENHSYDSHQSTEPFQHQAQANHFQTHPPTEVVQSVGELQLSVYTYRYGTTELVNAFNYSQLENMIGEFSTCLVINSRFSVESIIAYFNDISDSVHLGVEKEVDVYLLRNGDGLDQVQVCKYVKLQGEPKLDEEYLKTLTHDRLELMIIVPSNSTELSALVKLFKQHIKSRL
jgi:hypothetical protein